MADGPVIDLPAELYLRLHLVALGDGDVAHVVAEADYAQAAGEVPAERAAHPAAELAQYVLILPVAGYDLARQAHTRPDEPVLTVAVGGLVEVHEVHVYLFVGDAAVVLRGEVTPRLLQGAEAVYPHLARGEGVAPGDDAAAAVVVVGVAHYAGNLSVRLDRGLIDQRAREQAAGRHPLRHLAGALVDGFEHFGAVQELAADHEPELLVIRHKFS